MKTFHCQPVILDHAGKFPEEWSLEDKKNNFSILRLFLFLSTTSVYCSTVIGSELCSEERSMKRVKLFFR